MLLSSRIHAKSLAGLCRRLATALGAGIDVRTVFSREVDRASGEAGRRALRAVSDAVERGRSLAAALDATGNYFPTLFREMVAVGEQTGQLSEVFAQLADHYEHQTELRQTFLAVISWPLLQLGLAVLIVGFLIWIMGVIGQITGNAVDPLGFGLVGNSGLAVYVAVVTLLAAAVLLLVQAVRRGLVWTRPIQRGVLRIPALGKALETMALSRLAWALHLTMNTGMDVRRALRLSLQSTRNAKFTDQIEPIDAEIVAGNSIHRAFVATGCFPHEFLDALAVGEESGKLVESMGRLARQYREHARTAIAVLTKVGGLMVWMLIAAVIIFLIFRLFAFYLGTINNALEMTI
ncbi:MAG: type II secretion system F family protein [Pirellulales bacterium]|nr:type II secretion system F family protein [Pirellulales bacterium]